MHREAHRSQSSWALCIFPRNGGTGERLDATVLCETPEK